MNAYCIICGYSPVIFSGPGPINHENENIKVNCPNCGRNYSRLEVVKLLLRYGR